MEGILQWFSHVAFTIVESLGYPGLMLMMIVSSAGIPIPSEVVLPIAGVLVKQGKMDAGVVMWVAIIGQTLGAVLAYYIGAAGGIKFVKRYGHYVFFNTGELAAATRWFKKHGVWAAMTGRCIPLIRSYIAYPAGTARMGFWLFLGASVLGSVAWSAAMVGAGFFLADQLELFESVMRVLNWVVAAALAVLVVRFVWRHRV